MYLLKSHIFPPTEHFFKHKTAGPLANISCELRDEDLKEIHPIYIIQTRYDK